MHHAEWSATLSTLILGSLLVTTSIAQDFSPPRRLPPVAAPPDSPLAEAVLPPAPEAVTPETVTPETEAAVSEGSSFWMLPDGWLPPVEWEGGLEVGINGSAGNAEAASFTLGVDLTRTTELHEISLDLNYFKATANGIESQHNALLWSRYERLLGESPWTLFARLGLEYDEFRAFDLRVALNGGVGYQVIKNDATTWKLRFGSGASHELGGPDDRWVPEANFGTELVHRINERQKLKLTVDYFPEWGNFSNYRLVSNASWEMLLNEEHNLSLKLAATDRYDSTPNNRKPNDITYSALLLWKL